MQESQIILYTTANGNVSIEIYFQGETFWLTQKKIAELFGVDVRTVNEHLKNIFASGELLREATVRKNQIVQQEGNRQVSRELDFYNLDVAMTGGIRL